MPVRVGPDKSLHEWIVVGKFSNAELKNFISVALF